MNRTFRRIVTGVDVDGKSRLIDDSLIAEGDLGNFNLWMTEAGDGDRGERLPFFPPPGGAIFKVVRLPPPDPTMAPEDFDRVVSDFFAGVGSPECRVDTGRHPLMHVTPTTDYIMLLEGEVSLLLDKGDPVPLRPFDAVEQRGTNHTWLVTGSGPAVFLAVMAGSHR
jgi:hypothetical protein